jgi:hypothetical protein
MRRTASEVLRDLQVRVARLERTATPQTLLKIKSILDSKGFNFVFEESGITFSSERDMFEALRALGFTRVEAKSLTKYPEQTVEIFGSEFYLDSFLPSNKYYLTTEPTF